MPGKVKAWSYSRLSTYEICPAKIGYGVVAGIKEPQNAAMARGSDIHKKGENYLAKGGRVPAEYKPLAEEMRALRKLKPVVEGKWCFTKRWKETGWFDRDAWVRLVMDVFARMGTYARIIDFKTGKVRDENMGQLSLYALAVFHRYPDITKVTAELWYVDHGIIRTKDFDRSEMDDLTRDWTKRAKPLLNDMKFVPTPNFLCQWCFFSKEKGGPCKY